MLAPVALSLLSGPAWADAMPLDSHGVAYAWSLVNLDAYPDHVFVLYPTSNNGFGYVVDPEVPMTRLMLHQGWRGTPGTRVWALSREAFDGYAEPKAVPHGDDDQSVYVVPNPGSVGLEAELAVGGPGPVSIDDPVWRVERDYRIAELDDERFVLELVETRSYDRDGELLSGEDPADGLPASTGGQRACFGCSGAALPWSLGSGLIGLGALLLARRRET